jgi:transposase-like protein
MVTEEGRSVPEAAKNLGVDACSLRAWVKRLGSEPGASPTDSQGAVQAELRRLREEVRRLTMERDILKKATAFFAKESP